MKNNKTVAAEIKALNKMMEIIEQQAKNANEKLELNRDADYEKYMAISTAMFKMKNETAKLIANFYSN